MKFESAKDYIKFCKKKPDGFLTDAPEKVVENTFNQNGIKTIRFGSLPWLYLAVWFELYWNKITQCKKTKIYSTELRILSRDV